MLGGPGEGFKVAQARLGGGRVHHAMRTVGMCQRALEMMLERAVSRRTRGKMLGQHQLVQARIADSVIELEMFRNLVLKTAWIIDEVEAGRLPHGGARNHIGMCKVAIPRVMEVVIGNALDLHGSLGISLDLPLAIWLGGAKSLSFADGPTDVHKTQLARAYLKQAKPAPGLFPSEHIPTKRAEALARYPDALAPGDDAVAPREGALA
jgi:acyl-CoA dehydrogenase